MLKTIPGDQRQWHVPRQLLFRLVGANMKSVNNHLLCASSLVVSQWLKTPADEYKAATRRQRRSRLQVKPATTKRIKR